VQDYSKLLQEAKVEDLRLPTRTVIRTGYASGEYRLTTKPMTAAPAAGEEQLRTSDAQLQNNVLEFYSDLNAPIWTKHNQKAWSETLANIEKLRAAPTAIESVTVGEARFSKSRRREE